jgi:hypothetical protein
MDESCTADTVGVSSWAFACESVCEVFPSFISGSYCSPDYDSSTTQGRLTVDVLM